MAAAHALRSQGVQTVLVKLGSRGSLLVGERLLFNRRGPLETHGLFRVWATAVQ